MDIIIRTGSDDMYQGMSLLTIFVLFGLSMVVIYYLMERDFAIGILVAVLIGCCWYGFSEYDKSASERTSVGPISLSQVSDKVHVDGSKVIIDELPKNIVYAFDGTNGRKVFEYSYDEKYEIGKLKTASGSTLELTHKDTELLRSLGAK